MNKYTLGLEEFKKASTKIIIVGYGDKIRTVIETMGCAMCKHYEAEKKNILENYMNNPDFDNEVDIIRFWDGTVVGNLLALGCQGFAMRTDINVNQVANLFVRITFKSGVLI